MIDRIARITLYVQDQSEAEKFWIEKMGFTLRLKVPMGEEHYWIEVSPASGQTAFVLYDKALKEKEDPNANTQHPSIIFSTKQLMYTYQRLCDKGVKVTKILKMSYGSMFSFEDQDGNLYLIKEE